MVTHASIDLRALAVLAVLAIHALLVGFALRGPRRRDPGHEVFAAQAFLVALWSAGRLVTFLGWLEVGLAVATLASLASVALLARRLGAVRIAVPLAVSAAALLVVQILAGSVPPATLVPWLAWAGALYLAAPAAWLLRRRAAEASPATTALVVPPDMRAATPILVIGSAWHLLSGLATIPGPRLDVVGVLAAEAAVLGMIRSGQVELEPEAGSGLVRLAQSVATAAVVLVGVAIVHRYLGIAMDPASVTSLTALAFGAVWLLAGSGKWFESVIERALFPERARYRGLAEELAREREGLRSRLAQSERLALVGEMAASVAHEIKNPLGPIKGFAQMIAEDLERTETPIDRDVLRRRIAVIVEEVERIDERIRRLLAHARDPAEDPAPCALNELIERSVMLVAGDGARRPRVRVTSDLAATADEPPLTVRRRALESAIVNLLLNALDAVGDSGEVEISTATGNGAGESVEVRVRDDGRGIAPERLPTLFDPFVSGRPDGVGLGLGIARRAVEAEGGRISIASTEGRGTQVTVALPRRGPTA